MSQCMLTSVQFSHSVMSNSLRPHGLQHNRLPCPSVTPGAYSNSCPSSVRPSNHLILYRPLLLLPSIFPSISLFKCVSSSHQVAKILEWVAFPFSRGSSQPRDWTHVSCMASGFFTIWATGPQIWRQLSSLQSLSPVWLFATPWTAACQASQSITNSRSLPNPCPLSRWCHPTTHLLLSPSPPALNLSQHQGFFKWVSS